MPRRVACLLIAALACHAAAAPATGIPQVPIDFSYAGYGAGAAVPMARARVLLVRPGGPDDTAPLQAALRAAAGLPRRADGERNWVLADEPGSVVLLYSLDGDAIALSRTFGAVAYEGTWFDPRSGQTTPASLTAQPGPGTRLAKPDGRAWLLLLRARPGRSD